MNRQQQEWARMNYAETMISKKMKEADPTLEISGSDRRMLQIAYQDFSNYIIYSKNLAEEKHNFDLSHKMQELHDQDPTELELFLTIWTGIWLKKWRKRVKLLLGKQSQNRVNQTAKKQTNVEPLWRKLDCKEEIVRIVVSTLIKNAEICGTEILAESIIKMELAKKPDLDVKNKEQILALLNNALRRARQMAQTIGPLITMKISKNFF